MHKKESYFGAWFQGWKDGYGIWDSEQTEGVVGMREGRGALSERKWEEERRVDVDVENSVKGKCKVRGMNYEVAVRGACY